MQNSTALLKLAQHIRLLILDVDGVLTDGTIMISSSGEEIKCFNAHDGHGIRALQQAGITVAIISGRSSEAVTHRMEELDVTHVYQGQKNKALAFNQLLEQLQLTAEQVAYIGDDTPDLVVMQHIALPIAVANAVAAVKQFTPWHTLRGGGNGAVREVCDLLQLAITNHTTEDSHCD